MFNISFQLQLLPKTTDFEAFLPYFGPKTPKTPKTPNRQKPSETVSVSVRPKTFRTKNPKNSHPPKTFRCTASVYHLPKNLRPFSQFTAILYIPHPIKKYKNKYPLAKILKKWTTWTTRVIINDFCATNALHLRYILPKWTTLTRQKLHDTKRNHQTILS
jgi:hypothetical protein